MILKVNFRYTSLYTLWLLINITLIYYNNFEIQTIELHVQKFSDFNFII